MPLDSEPSSSPRPASPPAPATRIGLNEVVAVAPARPAGSAALPAPVEPAWRQPATQAGLAIAVGLIVLLGVAAGPLLQLPPPVAQTIGIVAAALGALALLAFGGAALQRSRRDPAKPSGPDLDAIIRQTSKALVLTDPGGRVTWVNAAFERLTGYAAGEWIGRKPGELLQTTGTDRAEVARLKAALDAEQPYRGELLNRDRHGHEYWVDIDLQPQWSPAGRLVGFVAWQTDVSQARRQQQGAIDAATGSAEWADLIDGAAIGTMHWNVPEDSIAINDHLLKLIGNGSPDAGPLSMKRWISLCHPDDVAAAWLGMKRHFDGEQPMYRHDIRVRDLAGQWRWLSITGSVVRRNEDRLPLTVSAIAIDIHAIRVASEQARAERSAADAARQSANAMLASIGQDVKGPLQGVLNLAEALMQASGLGAEQRATARNLHESARSLLAVLDDLIDFSRIEAGGLQLEPSEIDLTPLVEGVCDALAPIAAARDVHLDVFVQPDGRERVQADPVRLRQVLMNLIGFSIRFSAGRPGRAGRVRVRVGRATAPKASSDPARNGSTALTPGLPALRDADLVCFEIHDNGVGLDAATIERLFMPAGSTGAGATAQPQATHRLGGTGLSLAISRRLVDLMGGRIEVTSRVGEGSVFRVLLPLMPSRAQPSASPDLTGVRCVLIDSPDLPSVDLKAWLVHAGAIVQRCISAAGVRDAAARLKGVDAGTAADEPIIVVQDDRADPKRPLGDAPGRSGDDDNDGESSSRGDPAMRHLLVGRGRRSTARFVAPQVAQIDVLRRHAFSHAVGVLAGRIKPRVATSGASSGSANDDLLLGARVAPPTIEQARERGQLILVAEDDVTSRAVLIRQLGLLGYAAEWADTGLAALRAWQRGRHALLLSDLKMPEMDGYGLAEEFRRHEKANGWGRMPVVALTSQSLKAEAMRARESGMDDYLTKPVPLEQLQACLNQWMPAPRRRFAGDAAGDGASSGFDFVPIGTPASDWLPKPGDLSADRLLPAWPDLPALPRPRAERPTESPSETGSDSGSDQPAGNRHPADRDANRDANRDAAGDPPRDRGDAGRDRNGSSEATPTLEPAPPTSLSLPLPVPLPPNLALPAIEAPHDEVLDLRMLRGLVGGDETLVRELLLEFLHTVSRNALDLRESYRLGDSARAASLAHQVKSAARSVGAVELGEVCAAMERGGASDDPVQVQGRIEWFDQAFAAVCSRIEFALKIDGR